MAAPVIRRPRKTPAVETAEASPIVTRVGVPKVRLTPEEEREHALTSMDRDRRIHVETVEEFKRAGARVFHRDPLRCARNEAIGGDS